MGYLIGADIGTTGTKTILCDEKGKILASALYEYPNLFPRPGWSEQNADEWWKGTVNTIRAVIDKAGIDGKQVKGIGLSGQMHGLVMLDKDNKVLRRPILWNDQRTAAECAQITSKVGRKRLLNLTCNPALTGFTAPKILWVRKHEPKTYDKCTHILLPKDYIRFKLTGEYATEVSDASGMLLLDVNKRAWCKPVLDALDIDIDLLADCYESDAVSGKVTASVAKQLGISPGTPVVGGAGDCAAGAVGNGIVRTGTVSASLGTSGVVFAFCDKVEKDPRGRVHTFCHAVPGKWHVMGVMLSAGGSFRWLRDTLGSEEVAEAAKKKVDPYEILTKKAASAPAGSEGLIFLPYLTGERTPHADPNARGGWIGLTARHDKSHLIRAVLEGITFGMNDSLTIIKEMGIKPKHVRATGGGAVSKFWRQLQADIYRHKVVTINATEGPAYGVMLLAGVGTGVWKNVPQACDATVKITTETKPDAKMVKAYKPYYELYQDLYGDLKDSFATMAGLVS